MRLVKHRMAIGAPMLVLACSAGAGDFGGEDIAQDESAEIATTQQGLCGQGYWQCSVYWGASTTQRMMKGPTDFECGLGSPSVQFCGVPFHTCGASWVDIVGGISQSCNDHSSSFFGPFEGEWEGCTNASGTQVSNSARAIESVNQSWDRWPGTWRNGTYYGDLSWLSTTDHMRNPFATIYDLDHCSNKQIINSLFWPNFPVTAQLVSGDPAAPAYNPEAYASATWRLQGSTGLLCSDQDGVLADSGEFSGAKRPPVCSDLIVDGTFSCHYYPATPCSPYPDPGPEPGPEMPYPIMY